MGRGGGTHNQSQAKKVMSRGITRGPREKSSLFLLSLGDLNVEHIVTLLPDTREKFIFSKRGRRERMGWVRADGEWWGRGRDGEKEKWHRWCLMLLN